MKKHSHTYKTFDIILAPIPYTDSSQDKVRPALILSSQQYYNEFIEHYIVAMITTASNSIWPYDIKITDKDTSIEATSIMFSNGDIWDATLSKFV